MKRKFSFIGLIILILFSLIGLGCGTKKLEDKKEVADYLAIKSGSFNAKYTYLEKVKAGYKYKSSNYPNSTLVYDDSGNEYILVILNSDGSFNEKFFLNEGDLLEVKNAEIDARTIGNEALIPTLLALESDINIISNSQYVRILESAKAYAEMNENEKEWVDKIIETWNEQSDEFKEKYKNKKENLENSKNILNGKEKNKKANESFEENVPQSVTYKYKARFGEVKEANKLGKELTIKFKIKSSTSNKTTIDQNGFNIEDLILNQGASEYDKINYWAVADMADGSESKVISFTLNKDMINQIKEKTMPANQIIDYASDVWILPSLQQ